jgi:hypothetical protein
MTHMNHDTAVEFELFVLAFALRTAREGSSWKDYLARLDDTLATCWWT